jgi:streptogramin lyase
MSAAVPASCPEARLLGVRGSGETKNDHDGYGATIKSVVDWMRALEPAAVASPVDYPAIGISAFDPRYYTHRYENSVQSGVASLVATVSVIMRACPGRRLYLAGYSQGAQVVGDAYLDWLTAQERARVTRVVLLGDPKFVGGQDGSVNVGDFNPKLNGVVTLSRGHSRHTWATSDGAKVRSYCANGDPVCNFSSLGQAAGCKATSGSCPHMHYMGLDFPGTDAAYTQAAAQFLAARTRPPEPTPTLDGYAEVPLPADTYPHVMTVGPDGNLWLTAGNDRFARILRITTGGAVTVFPFPQPPGGNGFRGITAGPDGNLWSTAYAGGSGGAIARITPDGSVHEFALPELGSGPQSIATGPDGNLWFTQVLAGRIGRITTTGGITEFSLPYPAGTLAHAPDDITAGPDGNLWFTDQVAGTNPGGFGPYIGRITPNGSVTEYPLPHTDNSLGRITRGPDGNLWFTEINWADHTGVVGRITPEGVLAEFPLPGAPRRPFDIASGADGNLWLTDLETHRIARISVTGQITEYALPNDRRYPSTLVAGPDGNMWFTIARPGGYAIARFAP